MRKYLRHAAIILVLFVVIGAAAWWWISRPDVARLSEQAVTGKTPQLSPARQQYFPTMKVAPATGWSNGGKPVAAAGLQVAAFADKLDHPRWLYRLPNGDVLVAESNSPPRKVGGITGLVMGSMMKKAGAGGPSANRITLLRDTNGDGVADQRSALLEGLNSPHGMVLVGAHLYIANTDALVRYPFKPGENRIAAKAEKVIDLPGGGNHWARNVIASPDGQRLYVAIGSASNIAENGLEAERGRALILEVNPENKASRIYAWGLRNPNGLAFEPRSGSLWTVVNERDMLGSDMPPDYLTMVDFGAFYGWPWSYWGGYVDKRVDPPRPDLLEYTKRPDFALGAHTAPLGLAFAGDAKLGANWSNGAFIGLHGSWNREPPSGYKVVYVPFGDNGFPAKGARPVDLLTGFLSADGKAQGRPVGVITDSTGALLVADDVGNVIWRVSAK
jgi:glucose/arabinose dehydrogenase